MKLLTFAHFAEAQHFLKQRSSQALSFQGLYQWGEDLLLITGEGLYPAISKTAAVLGGSPVSEIHNYGVAGALGELSLGEVFSIRTVYGENQKQDMAFSSFTLDSSASTDCVSAFSRVSDKDYAKALSCFAPLVDRELWGVAYAASLYHLPVKAYKVTSDYADNSCQQVKDQAEVFSKKLWDAFCKTEKAKQPQHKNTLSFLNGDFYMTTSQEQQLKKLFSDLALKENKTPQEIFESLDKSFLNAETKKDRTQEMILQMQKRLNPVREQLDHDLNEYTKTLIKNNIQVNFDKTYESDEVEFKFKVKNSDEFKNIEQALSQFKYSDLSKILNGEKLFLKDKDIQ